MASLLQIQYTDIEKLIPYANNAKTHSSVQISQIAASIKEFGFNDPIGIDSEKGIVEGHGRLLAAQKLGIDKVPTIELSHLTETQKKAYILAHNRLAEVGTGWDAELLSIELESLEQMDFDIDLTGFDESFLLDDESAGLVEDDLVPDISEQCVSELGDIWVMGNHRLFCGDSTDRQSILDFMGTDLADVLITDPPYNVDYKGKTKDALTIKNDAMKSDHFSQFLSDAFKAADSVMKPGAVFYIWHADSEGLNFRQACNQADWQVRQCLIWHKNSFVLGRQDYHWQHEPCLYGWKQGSSHLWASDRKQTTVLNFDRPVRNDVHPTMKPVELVAYQIGNNTKKRDFVLDVFGGSGSTLIACEKLGRDGRIVELDPVYCDVIVRRWQAYTGEQAKHENGNKVIEQIEEV